ncbi:MAG TPA: response regulator [Rhizobiaceae bacterium]|nr:response regulator [Rhizobiaceae bacterium]
MAANALAGFTVLVLEDEFLIAMDVEQICRDHGADNVIIKRGLSELGDHVWSEKFDVALVDLMLAGESTLSFAKVLRERKIPFVFASGYADSETLASDFPGVGFIGKPYSESALIEAILAAVNSGR